ncbi:MAG: cobyric acid synthase [Methanomassiliicoccaceae archaeon]|nr:cobyric acid synthase [Methanomassiliicoccaceae archaeon]
MDSIKKKVKEEIDRGWTGPNLKCEYGPCHYTGQDCTYCFCPFYPCNDEELGNNIVTKKGDIWSCLHCHLIHRTNVCRYIASKVKELNITDPSDPKLKEMLPDIKKRFLIPGKAIMVLGATSDAGKSITTAALCRMISRKGYSVTPMKTQNMSLNSMITSDGSEVASIQMLQSKAARMKHPDHNINPILLKPMGSGKVQTIVNGNDFGIYDTDSYYNEFVPSDGIEAVRESISTLKKRYEFVVIEGAGSPAEINIYDKDIANMRAADIADADCILVVNMNWGGGFAYALGTVELLSDNDRKRVKGIILNNMRGDPSSLDTGIEELEKILKIPVLGVIPHINLPLPTEDSFALSHLTAPEGAVKICVIKLPRIANFTDMDPLYRENASVVHTEDTNDLKDADMIIIPGTKNSFEATEWMRSSGMDTTLKEMKGKVPIIGICGGYEIMCRTLSDERNKEAPSSAEGMGFFDADVSYNIGKRMTVAGVISGTDEKIKGYELHKGDVITKELPLFRLISFNGDECYEGSSKIKEKLFGTYIHGIFDEPAFRKFILEMTGRYIPTKYSDVSYDKILDETLDSVADIFTVSLNMNLFDKIFPGGRQ